MTAALASIRSFSVVERTVLLVVLVAALAVRWGLSDHFTHVDDIGVATALNDAQARNASSLGEATHVARLSNGMRAALQVPITYTYAPLQFFLTQQLLGGATGYRDTLFRGRLPSWIASVLAIAAILAAALRLATPDSKWIAIVSATIVALSAELAVYAQQMENYALGVFAMAGLLIVLTRVTGTTTRHSWWAYIGTGALLALLGHAHYQLLFAAPAFYGAWLLSNPRSARERVRIVVSGLTFAVLVMPLYFFLLKKWSHAGIDWNAGPSREFVFAPKHTVAAFVARAVTYFPRNAFLSFEATVSPVAVWHPLYHPLGAVLALAALAGLLALVRSRAPRERAMGQFVVLLGMVWIALIVTQRITLSPTRHSLVLLPVWAICIGAGVSAVAHRVMNGRNLVPLALLCTLVASAASAWPRTQRERHDKLDEADILSFLERHRVSAVVAYYWSRNISLMPSVLKSIPVFERQNVYGPESRWINTPPRSLDRIAFFSTRARLTPETFDSLRTAVNRDVMSARSGVTMSPWSEYRAIASRTERSDVEVDVSRLTWNGTNELYLVVLERRRAE